MTPNRTDVLNHLARKYGLKRFLEIGLQNASQNFDKIECEYKVSVDPDPNAHADFCMTSDQFFERINEYKDSYTRNYDLIFIDGLHQAEQVKKDFENSLKVLSPNGFIVLHDCNPEKEEHTIVPRPTPTGHWQGSVYKFACELGLYYKKFNVVDIDCGCGVWNNSGQDIMKDSNGWNGTWDDFTKNKETYLNIINWETFVKL